MNLNKTLWTQKDDGFLDASLTLHVSQVSRVVGDWEAVNEQQTVSIAVPQEYLGTNGQQQQQHAVRLYVSAILIVWYLGDYCTPIEGIPQH